MSKTPKLKGNAKARSGPYSLGEFNDEVIVGIGRQIVHRLAVGHADITGDDFAGIFAKAISGDHRASPLGVTDVTWNGCSWSAKTVQCKKPFTEKKVRLITGRNSVGYSYEITDPLADIQATGNAVLDIWNERVNQSLNQSDDLRIVVLMRNMSTLEFGLFEFEAGRYVPANYQWTKNNKGNLEGRDRTNGEHCFTWQPHGAQFTILKAVPASLARFRIKQRPGILEMQHVLDFVRFRPDWIERVDESGKSSDNGHTTSGATIHQL